VHMFKHTTAVAFSSTREREKIWVCLVHRGGPLRDQTDGAFVGTNQWHIQNIIR
jgi:hypothetical protein